MRPSSLPPCEHVPQPTPSIVGKDNPAAPISVSLAARTPRVRTTIEAVPMTQTPIQTTRNTLAKWYGIGIFVFTAVVGGITLLAWFLARLDLG